VSSVGGFLLGGLWYGALFTKPWIEAYRFTDEEVEASKSQTPRNFVVYLVCGFVMAAFVGVLVDKLGVAGAIDGVKLGGLLWVGLAGMIHMIQHVSGNYKPAAFLIDASYQLIWLLIIGAIMGAWR
jgi:hypothetical protein